MQVTTQIVQPDTTDTTWIPLEETIQVIGQRGVSIQHPNVLIVTHVSISQNFHTSFQKVSLIDTHVLNSFQKVSLIDTYVLNSQNCHTYFLRTFHLLAQREPSCQFAFQSH